MPVEKGAQLIAEDILREAKEKAAGIIRDAKKEARTILDAARLNAREEEKHEIEKAKSRMEDARKRMLAEGMLRTRKEILQKREELINDVFKKAGENFRKYSSSKKYEKDLIRAAASAIKKSGSDNVVIQTNHRNMKILENNRDQIMRELGGERQVQISFGEPIQTAGGVKVVAPDLKIEIDETFEGNMRREFETLRVKIAKILFEGSK